MRPDASLEPHKSYEFDVDVEGAPSFTPPVKGGDFEVDLSGAALFTNSVKGAGFRKPRVRGRDRNEFSTLLRHATHCSICNHPEREAIEQSILHWYSPTVIVHEFGLGDRRIVYRHAHALGLFRLRAQQSRHALGFLIEQAQSIVPSADAIIRAVRALSCIDDHGRWHEPTKRVIITHRYEDATAVDPTSRFESAEETTGVPPACTDRSERAMPQRRGQAARRRSRTRNTQERAATVETTEARHKRWSPLRLFSTRLLRKDRRNSNRPNKTAKTSRHTFRSVQDRNPERSIA